MYKIFLSILFTGLLIFSFSRDQQQGTSLAKAYLEADKLFREAEQLSQRGSDDEKTLEITDNLYLRALAQFKSLIPKIGMTVNDSLAFFIHTKAGFIEYYFDSVESAKQNYLTAINLKTKLPAIADSFIFSPLLFTGAIYYNLNQFDSALLFYKKAEQINDLYKNPITE